MGMEGQDKQRFKLGFCRWKQHRKPQLLKVATKRKWSSYHESILQRHQKGSKPIHMHC